MAGAGGGGQDNRQPSDWRSHQRGEPVLPAEPGIPAGTVTPLSGKHWGIENRLHWMLDVVFNEDQSRNRRDHCPEKPGADAETGSESGPVGTIEGVDEGQAQTRRLGQWLSRHHPIPVHQNPNAIVLPCVAGPVQSPNHTDVMSLRASSHRAAYRRRCWGTLLTPRRNNSPRTRLLMAAIMC